MNKIIDFNINNKLYDPNIIKEIEDLCKSGMPLKEEDIKVLLSNLSYQVRERIADYENVNMEDYSYSYKCDLAQSIIFYYLNELNIKTNPINTNEVINGVCGHSLITAIFKTDNGEKLYLIDPTYIQFFDKENCDKNKFVVINDLVCVTPDPGFFVVNANNVNILLPLLKNGYIELTEDVAKAYGDSFFQTKQGVSLNQIKNNVTNGSNYIKWFQKYTSKLSKTEKELQNKNLLINSDIKTKGKYK